MFVYDAEKDIYYLEPNTITGGGGWYAITKEERRKAWAALKESFTSPEDLRIIREAEDALES